MATDDIDGFEVFATKFRWISRIEAPDAPGFVFVGGELDPVDFGLVGFGGPVSLSGKGIAAAAAFAGCVGEGVEHLARLEWGDENLVSGTARTVEHGHSESVLADLVELAGYGGASDIPVLDWMSAVRLSDGAEVRVPAAICLRRPAGQNLVPVPSAISTGCAAGPTRAAAMLAALLELIERDAVALWWLGGRRGRPVGLNTLAYTGVAEFLRELRQGHDRRPTWLLNLTSDIGVPCVAALSATADGRDFACGTAARIDPAEAGRAALLELCQSELGYRLVAAKRSTRGIGALNDVDRRKLDRGLRLDARDCTLLHAAGFPSEMPPFPIAETAGETDAIERVVERLQQVGVEPLLIDLTRAALPAPAVRVIAPGLQPFPSSLATARLVRSTANLEMQAAEPPGIPLF